MTEPDEALLRAREIVAVEYENFEDPVSAEWVRRGSCDRGVVIIAAREAYRAGQAASAERIGKLWLALGALIYEVGKDGHNGSHLGDDGPSACRLCETVAGALRVLKEADQ
jgi:hypothetical protein